MSAGLSSLDVVIGVGRWHGIVALLALDVHQPIMLPSQYLLQPKLERVRLRSKALQMRSHAFQAFV